MNWEKLEALPTKEFWLQGEMEMLPNLWNCCGTCRGTYEILIQDGSSFAMAEWQNLTLSLNKQAISKKAAEFLGNHKAFKKHIDQSLILFSEDASKMAFLKAAKYQYDKYSHPITTEAAIYDEKNRTFLQGLLDKFEILPKIDTVNRWEKRNGKYYLKCSDGEKEYSEEDFIRLQDSLKSTVNILGKYLDYAKGSLTINGNEFTFASVVKIDLFVEEFQQAIEKHTSEGHTNLVEIIIDPLILRSNSDIANPLLKGEKKLNKYIKRKLQELRAFCEGVTKRSQNNPGGSFNALPPTQNETKKDRLKVPVIALIHIYEGKHITEDNAKDIAAKYGYTSKTSGKGLYDDFLKYCKASDRKAQPTAETKKTLINKIELFESVLVHLSNAAKSRAMDEIVILKTILESRYQ